jgi:hypothetical protein
VRRAEGTPACRTVQENPSGVPFVPICAWSGDEALQSAPKQKKQVQRNLAQTSQVLRYQRLTTMIRIPSLAPFFRTPPYPHGTPW